MSHHSDEPFDAKRAEMLRSMLNTTSFRGSTGLFPAGKIVPHDEGEIQFAVGEKHGRVVIEFGTSVRWIGMDPQQAADLAASLLDWARIAGRRAGKTITMRIGG